jgi:ElaB/YqjD/DUF883 family membrane-anchored ribosome-binding protein
MSDPNQTDSLKSIADEIGTLRRLTEKVHSRAGHESPDLLHKWMARREAIMERITELLPEDDSGKPVAIADVFDGDEREEVTTTLKKIHTLNMEAELILRERAGKIANKLQQLKAGKKLRENNRRWS